jgi:Putative peptidoglycan binding domain
MKRIVFLTCIGSLALALTAWGAPKGKATNRSARSGGAQSAHVVSATGGGHPASMRTSRNFSAARSHQRAVAASPRARSNSFARTNTSRSNRMQAARTQSTRVANTRTAVNARNRAAISRERSFARANATQANRNEAARIHNARGNARIARNNRALNRQRNLTMARNVAVNRAANARVVNNWRNARFRGSNYAAFYNYNRQWHDRGWWRNHHSRIVFVLGGWWYWNAGYWYPAWGYDSNAYYPYDGPIYGYGELAPDRIIVNVQVALQRDGYYAGPTDGMLGSQTREALAAFQADHGLTVTSAVDGPTLQTLGLA